MKKQPEVTDKTKRAFMDAFCELYAKKPIERISVQEIANSAGYNRSSFYQHFCDIYELLDYLESYVLASMLPKQHDNKTSIQDFLLPNKEMSFYLNTLFGEYGGNHFLERLKTVIPYEAHKLSLPKDDPLSPYLLEFHLSTVLSLFRLWYQKDKDLSQEELFGLIHNLYTKGVSAVRRTKTLDSVVL